MTFGGKERVIHVELMEAGARGTSPDFPRLLLLGVLDCSWSSILGHDLIFGRSYTS